MITISRTGNILNIKTAKLKTPSTGFEAIDQYDALIGVCNAIGQSAIALAPTSSTILPKSEIDSHNNSEAESNAWESGHMIVMSLVSTRSAENVSRIVSAFDNKTMVNGQHSTIDKVFSKLYEFLTGVLKET